MRGQWFNEVYGVPSIYQKKFLMDAARTFPSGRPRITVLLQNATKTFLLVWVEIDCCWYVKAQATTSFERNIKMV